jgi:hypothetical protein
MDQTELKLQCLQIASAVVRDDKTHLSVTELAEQLYAWLIK